LLSDLYSPDDVHALPAINTTDQQEATEEEDSYDDEANSSDPLSCGNEEGDTMMALKVP